jgi:DNA-binding transcriptional LysR family regulator
MAMLRNAPLLRQFLVVAQEGSLTAAAQRLALTQPALSKSIARLEAELGTPLFERLPRGVSLTVYGKALLPHAQRIDAECRLADRELRSLGNGLTGRLRVGAGVLFGATFVSSAIARIYKYFPSVSFTLHSGAPEENFARLLADGVDLMFGLLPAPEMIPPFLARQPMMEIRQRVIAGATHPLARHRNVDARDLVKYPWVVRQNDRDLIHRLTANITKDGAPPPTFNVEVTSFSAELQILRQGRYLSSFAETLDLPGVVALAYPPVLLGQAGVVLPRSLERYAPAAKLIELVRDSVATNASRRSVLASTR